MKTGKILPENILTFTQDARKKKINCSSGNHMPSCKEYSAMLSPFITFLPYPIYSILAVSQLF